LIAVVVAAAVLLGVGLGYRVLAHHLERGSERAAIRRGTLKQLPLRIGNWVGREEALDESIVRATAVDDYVNRFYVRRADNQVVRLWLAFGVRARDLMPHRPEVCYPGAGWTLRDQNTTVLRLRDGTALRVRIFAFARGGLDPRDLTVLNYYIVDGETSEDVSLLRSKAWRGQGAIGYMAQVQITYRVSRAGPRVSPIDVVRAFATDSFGPIVEVLNRTLDEAEVTDERAES